MDTYEPTGAPFDLRVRAARQTISLVCVRSGEDTVVLDIPRKRVQELIDTLQYLTDIG